MATTKEKRAHAELVRAAACIHRAREHLGGPAGDREWGLYSLWLDVLVKAETVEGALQKKGAA